MLRHGPKESLLMDILTALNRDANYSSTQLQLIIGAWVMSGLIPQRQKISTTNGDVAEGDYDKRSIYALLYALYHAVGDVKSDQGEIYEMTFNTWGYSWPPAWGADMIPSTDPQRFGKAAYLGLFAFEPVREYIKARNGKVHVVEMGCGTGAGAHLICRELLPECTYEAIDMQRAAIETCKRKFVPELGGRLVWGNAIPESTWKPCFEVLESVGLKVAEVRDVTQEAILARDLDKARAEAFVQSCLSTYHAFRIPFLGGKKRLEAEAAIKNFYRHPGTNLYQNMQNRTDTYKVVMAQKTA
jgi:hypothetical protein